MKLKGLETALETIRALRPVMLRIRRKWRSRHDRIGGCIGR